MRTITSNFNAALFMRVGSLERIRACYESQTISFGCAANWVDIAKTGNQTTGDALECVYAHLKKGTPVDVRDCMGNPMGNHLQELTDSKDGTKYLRFVPTLLTPALCLFSFSVDKLLLRTNQSEIPFAPKCIRFDLLKYRTFMEYNNADDTGFLFITDIGAYCFTRHNRHYFDKKERKEIAWHHC